MENNLVNKVKNKVIEIKDSTINFCEEHKEILAGIALTATTCGCAYFGIKYYKAESIIDKQGNIIKNKNSIINNLINNNSKLSSQLKVKDSIINDCHEQIKSLKSLCNGKDKVMDFTMSDGFRHGSPECARQMSYKRWYYQA